MTRGPALVDGAVDAVRYGRHVLVRMPRETFARVVTLDAPRSSTTWGLRTPESAATVRARMTSIAAAELPRLVDAVDLERGSLVVFDAPDGVTLEEILLRTDVQRAVLDPAVAVHLVIRALDAAGAPRAAGALPVAEPIVDASAIRVGFDGAFCFLGMLPRGIVRLAPTAVVTAFPELAAEAQRDPDLLRRIDEMMSRESLRPAAPAYPACRALVARVVRGLAGGDDVLGFMDQRAPELARTPGILAWDPSPWLEVARGLDRVLARLDPVDEAHVRDLARSLFPEDHRAALAAAEQTALLGDDELRAIVDSIATR